MILRYMKIELSREPRKVVDWVRYARLGLRHLLSTHRTLCRDGNAVLVISHLHRWCQHVLSVARTEVSFGRLLAIQEDAYQAISSREATIRRIDARWRTITSCKSRAMPQLTSLPHLPPHGGLDRSIPGEKPLQATGDNKHIRCLIRQQPPPATSYGTSHLHPTESKDVNTEHCGCFASVRSVGEDPPLARGGTSLHARDA